MTRSRLFFWFDDVILWIKLFSSLKNQNLWYHSKDFQK